MLLISKIIYLDAQKATTHAVAQRSWPLQSPHGVSALILIELVAQTAGVCNGYTALKDEGADADIRGWIVGVKSAQFFIDHIPVDTLIETTAENQFEYDQLRETRGVVKMGDRIIGEATLQLMRAI
jgi:predicted hotdog family 3-hydroxylacyl-ACP dehydratase